MANLLLCLLGLTLLAANAYGKTQSVTAFVDAHIGTGGDGFGVGGDPPGAQMPFGAMRASPDTSKDNVAFEWEHFGGYHYYDDEIRCFSHTHMVGPGVQDLGNIGVMPVAATPSEKTITNYGFRAKFSHEDEIIVPGYYGVALESGITAEMTACGSHTAIHQYTWNASVTEPTILVLPSHSLPEGAVQQATVDVAAPDTVTGSALQMGALTRRNGLGGVNTYFAMQTSIPFESSGVWVNQTITSGASMEGRQIGAYLTFPAGTKVVELTVAISFISVNEAINNLKMQVQGRSFSSCLMLAKQEWERTLEIVQVNVDQTQYKDDLVKFYTALYHSFMAPTTFTESSNSFLGMDNVVHQVPDGDKHFTDLSIWDVFRTQMPLLALLLPNVHSQVARSLVRDFTWGGDIPRWPILNVYSGCMIGTHANQILLDALVKNTGPFDEQTAYEGMRLQATDPNRPHIGRGSELIDYINLGFIPLETTDNSVSKTLEFAYDDWAVGTFAKMLGLDDDAELFLNRSKNYKNVWDAKTEYFCPRHRNGTFKCNEVPDFHEWILKDSGFVEGDAAEWRWFVPHDLEGLVGLFKSKEDYVRNLDHFFKLSANDKSTFLPNPHYWAGNEPDILEPFQFNVAGRADLTQKYSRWVMNFSYSSQPDGLPGNDDYGALSSWYVWAALGLYPLPGSTTYILGSPSFSNVTLNLVGGKFTILAHSASPSNIYVQKAQINGRHIDMLRSAYVDHKDISSGGLLEFWMGADPLLEKE